MTTEAGQGTNATRTARGRKIAWAGVAVAMALTVLPIGSARAQSEPVDSDENTSPVPAPPAPDIGEYQPLTPRVSTPNVPVRPPSAPTPEVSVVVPTTLRVPLATSTFDVNSSERAPSLNEQLPARESSGVVTAGWAVQPVEPSLPGRQANADATSESAAPTARDVNSRRPSPLDGELTLETIDPKIAENAGFDHVAVELFTDAGAARALQQQGGLTVGIDYSSFRGAHGGAWDQRVQLVWFEGCWLEAIRAGLAPSPSCPLPEPLDSTNDLESGAITATLSVDSIPSLDKVTAEVVRAEAARQVEAAEAPPVVPTAAPLPETEPLDEEPVPAAPAEETAAGNETDVSPIEEVVPTSEVDSLDAVPVPETEVGDPSATQGDVLSDEDRPEAPSEVAEVVPAVEPQPLNSVPTPVDDDVASVAVETPPNNEVAAAPPADERQRVEAAPAVAQLSATGGFALMSSTSSEAGDFGATSLNFSDSWDVGLNTGSFNWSYNLPAPSVPAGPTPDLTLSYSSGRLDGVNADSNNQGGMLPHGWSMATDAFIEKSLEGCDVRFAGVPHRNKCFDRAEIDNATISLAGHSGMLIKQGNPTFRTVSGVKWEVIGYRLERDTGLRVERWRKYVDGAQGGSPHTAKGAPGVDNDREHFVAVDTDGTQYWFGYGEAAPALGQPDASAPPANANATAPSGTLNSVLTVPVVGITAEPCHYLANPYDGWCHQGYRWMLDNVVSSTGLSTVNLYGAETNKYHSGSIMANGYSGPALSGGTNKVYSSSHRLKTTWYGVQRSQAAQSGKAAARVNYSYEFRCNTPGSCSTAPTSTNGAQFPDVPSDLICDVTYACGQFRPAFFNTRWLTNITTERKTSGPYRKFSELDVGGFIPTWYPGEPPQHALTDLQRSGYDAAGVKETLPLVQTAYTGGPGYCAAPFHDQPHCAPRPNRVRSVLSGVAGVLPLVVPRVNTITDELGSLTKVEFSPRDPACGGSSIPGGSWRHNTRRCFANYYSPADAPQYAGPITYNKYVVTRVTVTDRTRKDMNFTSQSVPVVTDYTYSGPGTAWERSVRPSYYLSNGTAVRYHNDFRGYQRVDRVVRGGGSPDQGVSHYFMRGLGGSANHPNHVNTVMPNTSAVVADTVHHAGFEFKTERYLNNAVHTTDWRRAALFQVSSHADAFSRRSKRLYVDRTWRNEAGARSATAHSVDSLGRPSVDVSYGAVNSSWANSSGPTSAGISNDSWATTADHSCTRRSYTPSTPLFAEGLQRDVLTRLSASLSCGSGEIIGRSLTYFDGSPANAAAPIMGLPTWTRRYAGTGVAAGLYGGVAGSNWIEHRTNYESSGWRRPIEMFDARGIKTAVSYVAFSGTNPNTKKVVTTSPMSFVSEVEFDELGRSIRARDAADRDTWTCSDAFGRLVGVWHADNPKPAGPCSADLAATTASVAHSYSYTWSDAPEPYYAGPGPHVPNWLVTSRELFAKAGDSFNPTSGDLYTFSAQALDGLGRVRESGVRSGQANHWAVMRSKYDGAGQVVAASAPQAQSGCIGCPAHWYDMPVDSSIDRDTVTTYDGLGRPLTAQLRHNGAVVRTQTTTYSGLSMTTAAPVNAGSSNPYGATTSTRDVFGNVVSIVKQAPGQSPATQTTLSGYNLRGELEASRDPLGNTTRYTRNLLGWVTALDEPNAGARSTVYYKTGEVRSATDARGVQISSLIDARGRVIRTAVGPHPSIAAKQLSINVYDILAKGTLTRALSYDPPGVLASVERVEALDTVGRTTSHSVRVQAADDPSVAVDNVTDDRYTFGTTFTRNGQVATSTYPAMAGQPAETVTHTFDALGRPLSAGSPAAPGGDYIAGTTYDSIGRVTSQDIGGGSNWLRSQQQFDPADGRVNAQMTRATSPSAGVLQGVQGGAITYDAAGNPTSMDDIALTVAGRERQCYYYDSRQRLDHAYTVGDTGSGFAGCATSNPAGAAASGPAPYNLDYRYDAGDRFVETANRVGIQHGASPASCAAGTRPNKPHAVTAVGAGNGHPATALEYDCNGSIASRTLEAPVVDDRWRYSFDEQNRLETVEEAEAIQVTWVDQVGTRESSNLERLPAPNGWSAGAVSEQSFSGDGAMTFRIGPDDSTTATIMIGLGSGNTNQGYSDVDYAIYLYLGQIYVRESGANRGQFFSNVTSSDVFSVRRTGTLVEYLRNGAVFYTSTVSSTGPLNVDSSLYRNVPTGVTDVRITSGATPDVPVEWANVVGVVESKGLVRVDAPDGWTAGAASAESLSGDGEVSFEFSQHTNHRIMAGLADDSANTAYGDIEFAIYKYFNSRIYVFESGANMFAGPVAQPEDVFSVRRTGDRVDYLRNGEVFYTSTKTSTGTLEVDASLFEGSGGIEKVYLRGVIEGAEAQWRNLEGTRTSSNLERLPAPNGWTAGAVSEQSFSGDGAMSFRLGPNDTNNQIVMIGLGQGNANQGYHDIDYAIYVYANWGVDVRESGTSRGFVFSDHSASDVLSIRRTGTLVEYLRNGTVFYTSTVPSAGALNVDSSFYRGSTSSVSDVRVTDGTTPDVAVTWTDAVGVAESQGLVRTDAANGWSAGARSVASFRNDGEMSFVFSQQAGHHSMAGLSQGSSTSSFTDIQFAIYKYADGRIRVYESGSNVFTSTIADPEDVFTVRRRGQRIEYLSNGDVFYTSLKASLGALNVDTALHTGTGGIEKVVLRDFDENVSRNVYNTSGQRRLRIDASGDWTVYFGTAELRFDKAAGTVEMSRQYPGGVIRNFDGSVTYSITNHQGTVVGAMDAATGTVSRTRYDPYGAIRSGATVNDQGFLNQKHDAQQALVYLNNRSYDPTIGVFVSVDPLVTKTMEPYIYGSANPVRYTDPSGLCTLSKEFCAVNGAAYKPTSPGSSRGGNHSSRRQSTPQSSRPDHDGVHLRSYFVHLEVPAEGGFPASVERIGRRGNAWAYIDGRGALQFGVNLPREAQELLGSGRVEDEANISVNGSHIPSQSFGHKGNSRRNLEADYGFHASSPGKENPLYRRARRTWDVLELGPKVPSFTPFEVDDVVVIQYKIKNTEPYRSDRHGWGPFEWNINWHDTVLVTMSVKVTAGRDYGSGG